MKNIIVYGSTKEIAFKKLQDLLDYMPYKDVREVKRNYEDIILDILIDVFADDNDWIGYFVYDLEFGKNWESNYIKDNDRYIALQTPEDLYDILTGNPRYL